MVTYSKLLLSGSTNGKSIPVGAAVFPASLIHTAINDPNNFDEIYLYAINSYGSNLNGTIWWGGTTTNDAFVTAIPPNGSGRLLVVDGRLLNNNQQVTATTTQDGTNGLFIEGFVNRISGIAAAIDIRVLDWANRVVLNGGALPSLATQQALTAFYLALDSAGITKKMVSINCLVPDSLTAALTPLLRGPGFDPWQNHNLVSGDLTVNGLTGNTSNKYADSGIPPKTAYNNSSASLGVTVYCYFNPLFGSYVDFGADDSGSQVVELLVDFNGQTFFDAYGATVGTGRLVINNAFYRGYLSGNYGTLDGTTKEAIYQGSPFIPHGVLTSTTAALSGTPGVTPLALLAFNASNSIFDFCPRTLSFAAVHGGLLQSESLAFYNAIQTLRVSLGGGYVDPDPVADWAKRVVFNGGPAPTAATRSALTALYNGLVSNNLLGKMKVIVPVVPDSLIAATTPFWNMGGGMDPWTNHNFVSGDLTINGLRGDGSTKYLDTGFIPSISYASTSDAGLTIYVSSNNSNANDVDLYTQASGGATDLGLLLSNLGTTYFDAYAPTPGGGRISTANSGFLGYVSGNHGTLGGGIIQAIYEANSGSAHSTLVSSSTSVGGILPTVSLFAAAGNNGSGTAFDFSSKRYSFFAIHSGLTSTESLAFYNLIQAFRTTLGGGFV